MTIHLALARTSFSPNKNAPGGGGGTLIAISLLSVIELRNKDQRIAGWGRSESNGVRVDLFRPTVNLPGQAPSPPKKCFSRGANFVKFFVNNFLAI